MTDIAIRVENLDNPQTMADRLKVLSVFGTRPEAIEVALVVWALAEASR